MTTLVNIALLIFIFGTISATLVMCIYKWRLDEAYQIFAPAWLPREFCDFCIGFWISFVLTAILIFFISNIFYIAIPFGSASISKTLVNIARGNYKSR
jgi:hypothetical protein